MRYNWKFDGERIFLADEMGRMIYPTAQQIFSCAFGSGIAVGDLSAAGSPLEFLPDISFSRYPAEPAVRVIGSPPQPLRVSVGVLTDSVFSNISDGVDQIVVSNHWYPIDTNSVSEVNKWLASLGISANDSLTIGQIISLRGAQNSPVAVIDDTSIDPADVAAKVGEGFDGVLGLNATLYPYQRDGVAFLKLVAEQGIGCVLADEMGLGKTLQIVALLQSETNSARVPSLVVAPATLLENWRREIQQFAPHLSCLIHAGASRAGIAQRIVGYDVVITSFDTATRDESLLSDIHWDVLIVDEAQAIKNPEAQRTHAIKRIPRRVSIAVTGTPVENCLGDLWSLSDFVLPGLLGTVDRFRAAFADDIEDAGRLGAIVAPILLRRKVEDVAHDLPAKIEIPQPIAMSREIAEAYEQLRKQTLDEYGPAAGIVATTRLRVLCAHPLLVQSWNNDPAYEMPKYQRLLEILEEIFESKEKALIFTSYQAMADLFMKDIPQRWPDGFFRYIDGRVPVLSRQPTVDDFYAHTGFGALFLNPKAAGAGLNITTANHVIHYNPEWNPAVTAQATARAYRRKQQRPVTIHHLYFADSIEEIMIERAEFKRELAEGAITGHEGAVDSSIILRALQISPISKFERTKA